MQIAEVSTSSSIAAIPHAMAVLSKSSYFLSLSSPGESFLLITSDAGLFVNLTWTIKPDVVIPRMPNVTIPRYKCFNGCKWYWLSFELIENLRYNDINKQIKWVI